MSSQWWNRSSMARKVSGSAPATSSSVASEKTTPKPKVSPARLRS